VVTSVSVEAAASYSELSFVSLIRSHQTQDAFNVCRNELVISVRRLRTSNALKPGYPVADSLRVAE
jgi:hypothetical protein